jgi:predicted ester cyclase
MAFGWPAQVRFTGITDKFFDRHELPAVFKLTEKIRGGPMATSTALASPTSVEAFIKEYFAAWQGTDEGQILSYYTDNVVLQIPNTIMNGKGAVRDQFVHPFIGGFPGNRHIAKKMIFGQNVVVVEWNFEAEHKGTFAGIAPTGKHVQVPGCSVYEYDPTKRQISAGRIYFDVGTLLKQIGAA